MSTTTVLIADDHQIVRQGLRSLLDSHPDLSVVGEAADGRAAIEMARQLKPDVVVMDVGMPDLNGIDATRQVSSLANAPQVVALSMHADRRFAGEMLRAGAKAYVLKESAFEELASAIREAMQGKVFLSPRIAGVVVEDYVSKIRDKDEEPNAFSRLSPREREVLQLMAEGRSTKEIARDLGVSVKTVETHRRQLMTKLNLYTVAELTKYAVREGLTALS
jgi:RNA polymerase sigma factor (sigma-70 family)